MEFKLTPEQTEDARKKLIKACEEVHASGKLSVAPAMAIDWGQLISVLLPILLQILSQLFPTPAPKPTPTPVPSPSPGK